MTKLLILLSIVSIHQAKADCTRTYEIASEFYKGSKWVNASSTIVCGVASGWTWDNPWCKAMFLTMSGGSATYYGLSVTYEKKLRDVVAMLKELDDVEGEYPLLKGLHDTLNVKIPLDEMISILRESNRLGTLCEHRFLLDTKNKIKRRFDNGSLKAETDKATRKEMLEVTARLRSVPMDIDIEIN